MTEKLSEKGLEKIASDTKVKTKEFIENTIKEYTDRGFDQKDVNYAVNTGVIAATGN